VERRTETLSGFGGRAVFETEVREAKLSIDEHLEMAAGEAVFLRSRSGDEFVLEAADAFDREVEELGRSQKIMAFLNEAFQEPGRIPIEEIERRLDTSPPGQEEGPLPQRRSTMQRT
jgi:hypothetical protein